MAQSKIGASAKSWEAKRTFYIPTKPQHDIVVESSENVSGLEQTDDYVPLYLRNDTKFGDLRILRDIWWNYLYATTEHEKRLSFCDSATAFLTTKPVLSEF